MNSVLVSLAAIMAVILSQAGTPARVTYTYDIFQYRAVRFQNPDMDACTAATTMTMLNLIYYTTNEPLSSKSAVQAAQPPLVWKPSITTKTQTSIYRWERSHMGQSAAKPGVDGHGWRNALNYFGWGDMKAGAYSDQAYRTFDQAAKAAVRAVAVANEPVGIMSWYGSHAQIVTGYRVTGMDPRTGSMDFSIVGVYLSDPLRERKIDDKLISYADWKSGDIVLRFAPYLQGDSIYRDPIDGQVGRKEWWQKYVIIAPVLGK
jgi:hypothetical protein